MKILSNEKDGCLCKINEEGIAIAVLWSNPPYFIRPNENLSKVIGFNLALLKEDKVFTSSRTKDGIYSLHALKIEEGWFCYVTKEDAIERAKDLSRPSSEEDIWHILEVVSQIRPFNDSSMAASIETVKELNCRLNDMQRELMKKQHELERNKVMLNAAMESANVMIWIFDFEKRCIYDYNGLTEKNSLPRYVENVPESLIDMELIHEASHKEFMDIHRKALQGMSAHGIIKIKENNRKRYAWKEILYTPVADEWGNFTKAIGTGIDITEQRDREENYENQIKVGRILTDESIFAGLFNITQNTVSETVEKDKDMSLEEGTCTVKSATKALSLKYIKENERESFKSQLEIKKIKEEFLKGQVHGRFRNCNIKDDGWLETRYELLQNPYTGDVEMILNIWDVTNFVKAEKVVDNLLRFDYENILLLQADTGVAVSYKDVKVGVIEEQKRQGDPARGVESILRKYCIDEDVEKVIKETSLPYIREMLEKSSRYVTSYTIFKDGERKHKRILYSYLDESRRTILCAIQDLTYTYEREEEQRAQLQRALHAARKADQAKTEFFSRMSHEMRTPMNGILGVAELSAQEEDVKVLLHNMEKIKDSGVYMMELINDTLDFQKMESGRLEIHNESVSLSKIVEELKDMISPNADLRNLTFDIATKNIDLDVCVMTDPLRLKQIFANLLMNGVKFTPEGGIVRFSIEGIKKSDHNIHVRFKVIDTGIGMSEDFIENRIFKIYEQEDNSMTSKYAGSGLGLAITKKLVDMMGGVIQVESEQGSGSSFTIDMHFEPSDGRDAERYKENSLTEHKEMLKNRRILVCEDHQLNAEILCTLLERVGCKVTLCENGQQGIESFQESNPFYYDVILMDMRMPVMDGLTATKKIRNMNRPDAHLPIIAVTANAYDTDRKQMEEAGVSEYLIKPINVGELYSKLEMFI